MTLSTINPTESHQNKIVERVGREEASEAEEEKSNGLTTTRHSAMDTTHVKRRRGKETKPKAKYKVRKREKEQTLPRVAPRTLALRDFVSKEKQDRIPVPKLEKRTKN
jgi:hypothetical protein